MKTVVSWESFEDYSVVPRFTDPSVGYLVDLSVVEVDEILKCGISGEHSKGLTIVSVPEIEQRSRTTMDDSHFWGSSGQAVNECFPCTR